jgi:hypothetical protein
LFAEWKAWMAGHEAGHDDFTGRDSSPNQDNAVSTSLTQYEVPIGITSSLKS